MVTCSNSTRARWRCGLELSALLRYRTQAARGGASRQTCDEGRGRHSQLAQRPKSQKRKFRAAPEERPVFLQRATEGIAKLILEKRRFCNLLRFVLKRIGVQAVVVEKFKDAAMKPVGSGPGHHLRYECGGTAVFR